MTEHEWDASDNPCRMLAHLNRLPGDRKLLLYAVACCRAHWDLLEHPASHEAVEWAERYAEEDAQRDDAYTRVEYKSEGVAFSLEASSRSQRVAEWASEEFAAVGSRNLRGPLPRSSPRRVDAAYFANALMTLDTHDPYDPTLSRYWKLLLERPLRDVFGNPFRPVTFDPAWRNDTAVALAGQMYESRDFGAMPILADALQDAGCDSADILDHCRRPGEHVRGCWVADLVLGKA